MDISLQIRNTNALEGRVLQLLFAAESMKVLTPVKWEIACRRPPPVRLPGPGEALAITPRVDAIAPGRWYAVA